MSRELMFVISGPVKMDLMSALFEPGNGLRIKTVEFVLPDLGKDSILLGGSQILQIAHVTMGLYDSALGSEEAMAFFKDQMVGARSFHEDREHSLFMIWGRALHPQWADGESLGLAGQRDRYFQVLYRTSTQKGIMQFIDRKSFKPVKFELEFEKV